MLASNLCFVNGRAQIKRGGKNVARLYDRAVFYAASGIKTGFPPAFPFSLDLAGVGVRECASLEEALFFYNKYTA